MKIGSEIKGTRDVVFEPGIHLCFLENVTGEGNYFTEEELKKPEEIRVPSPRLKFEFSNRKEGSLYRVLIHYEYGIKNYNPTKPNNLKAFEIKAARIKHIYETFVSAFPSMPDTNGFGEFYDWIGKAFNNTLKVKEGETPTSIYADVEIWLKVVYDNQNRLGIPDFPNFIEKANKGARPSLRIVENKDKIKPTAPVGVGSMIPPIGSDSFVGGFGSGFDDDLVKF